MNKITKLMDLVDLNENEAIIYLDLLKKGTRDAKSISYSTGIERTLTYSVLNSLRDKGLVSFKKRSEKRYYNAAPPETIARKAQVHLDKTKDLVSNLNAIETRSIQEVNVSVYEGRNALRTMFERAENFDQFLTVGASSSTHKALYEMPHIVDTFKESSIDAKIIVKRGQEHTFQSLKQDFEYRVLDVTGSTYNIFGPYVAHVILDDKKRVVLVKNQANADMQRSVFKHLWKSASELG